MIFFRKKKTPLDEIYSDGAWLEIIANSEDTESAKENFAGYLAAKRNPQMALKQVTQSITKGFKDDLNEIIRDGNDDDIMLGLMGQASVVDNIKAFKSSTTLQHLSGLSKTDFEKLVDSIAKEVLTEYFE